MHLYQTKSVEDSNDFFRRSEMRRKDAKKRKEFIFTSRSFASLRRIEGMAKTTLLTLLLSVALTSCQSKSTLDSKSVATPLHRSGDEIIVCGKYFHTGTPVVLWTDEKGYDAYRVDRRFVPYARSSWAATTQDTKEITYPARYNTRKTASTQEAEEVRGGGWPLPLLKQKIDQFVLHYDADGTSMLCFKTLHDERGLSVHFLLDLDGTIYQTLDLKERAWHAAEANDRSIGIEIANIGAYPLAASTGVLGEWYKRLPDGTSVISLPTQLGDGGLRNPKANLSPARNDPVYGFVQHIKYRQYDFTPQQYQALAKLTATLCTIFPNIKCDYPRDGNGRLVTHALSKEQLDDYKGILGHYHVTAVKQDPGPAFQWDRLITSAQADMAK